MASEATTEADGGAGSARLSAPSPRRLFVVAIFAAVIGLMVTLSFGYADHHPRPHGVRVALAAPAPVRDQLAGALARTGPGAFTFMPVLDAGAARRAVRDQSVLGAFIVPARGATTIVTAGVQGPTAVEAITQVLGGVSTRLGRPARSVDVVSAGAGDPAGTSSFVFGLGLLIPSVIGSVGIFLLGNRLRIWWRVAAAIVFSVAAACAGTLAMDTILGALTGNPAALIGVGVLGALAFVTFVSALQAMVGLPGTGLAALAFVFVGNAMSGGTVPVAFLPDVFRQIAPWLPNNAIIRAVRDVIYYNGHDLGHPLLVLGVWIGVAMAVLVWVDALHLSARRRRPDAAAEIYSTPAVVHLRRRIRGLTGGEVVSVAALAPGASVHAPLVTGDGSRTAAAPLPGAGNDPGRDGVVKEAMATHQMMKPPEDAWMDVPALEAFPPGPEHWPLDPPDSAWMDTPADARDLAPAEPSGPRRVPARAWMSVPARVAVDVGARQRNGFNGPHGTNGQAGAGTATVADEPEPSRSAGVPDPAPIGATEPELIGATEPETTGATAAPAVAAAETAGPMRSDLSQARQLPANTGIPRVPDLHRAGSGEVRVEVDRVTVRARTVVIEADEIHINAATETSVLPGSPDAEAPPATPRSPEDH